jgi:hypothetical protein
VRDWRPILINGSWPTWIGRLRRRIKARAPATRADSLVRANTVAVPANATISANGGAETFSGANDDGGGRGGVVVVITTPSQPTGLTLAANGGGDIFGGTGGSGFTDWLH